MDRNLPILVCLAAAIGLVLGAIMSMRRTGWRWKMLGTGLIVLAVMSLGVMAVVVMAM
jgi:hypothetical protein